MKRRSPRVTLYGTAACGHCRQARQWLRARGIAFRELDIERNARARRAFERHGGRGVPLILVGETLIRGFDPRRLSQALRLPASSGPRQAR